LSRRAVLWSIPCLFGPAACDKLIGADFDSARPKAPSGGGGDGFEESGATNGGAAPSSQSSGGAGARAARSSSSAAGGDAGAGGEAVGGGAGASQCTSNADCAAFDACVRVACIDDRCVESAYCPEPAEAACVATCSSNGAAITCGVAAPDHDGDQHGDGRCSRGDDCDDGDDRVYPGAEEVCDGVDGNCDGQSDLEELGLGGQTLPFLQTSEGSELGNLSTVWSSRARAFGVAWEQYSGELSPPLCFFNLLRTDGTAKLSAHLPVSDALEGALTPSIAASDEYLGVAWIDLRSDAPGVYFKRYEASSGGSTAPLLVSSPTTNPIASDPQSTPGNRPVIVALPHDGWAIFWIAEVSPGEDQVFGARINEAGEIAAGLLVGEPGGEREHLGAAANGDAVAIVWANRPSTGTFSVVEWALLGGASLIPRLGASQARLSSSVGPGGTTSATHPVVAELADGFAAAWRFRYSENSETVESLRVTHRSRADGTVLCTSQRPGLFFPSSLTEAAGGFAVGGYRIREDGGRDVLIMPLSESCEPISDAVLVRSEARESTGHAGPILDSYTEAERAGVGITWSQNLFGVGEISARLLGPNLCD
jgi:hypothetical protein